MKKPIALALAVLSLALPVAARAADSTPPSQKLMSKLTWRNIGPFIGAGWSRSPPTRPNQRLLLRRRRGRHLEEHRLWAAMDEHQRRQTSARRRFHRRAGDRPVEHQRDLRGTGESDIRNDFYTGAGIYKSTDAGETWHYAGLSDTHTTSALAWIRRTPISCTPRPWARV